MRRISTTTTRREIVRSFGSIEGVEVKCDRCGHAEEGYGVTEDAVRRCAALLRENCPLREKNLYLVGS